MGSSAQGEKTAGRRLPALRSSGLAALLVLAGCVDADRRPAWEHVAVGGPALPRSSAPSSPAAGAAGPAAPKSASTAVERKMLAPPAGAAAASSSSFPATPIAARSAGPADVAAGKAGMVATASTAPPRPVIDPAWTGVETYTARHEDTLIDLAAERRLGFIEVAMANPGVDPWLPGEGREVLLPKQHLPPDGPREGIVLNLSEQRLYYYERGRLVRSYPIGIGRDGHATPVGRTSVVAKTVDPVWRPTPSARADDPELPAAVPAGPDNPLGSRALYLGWSSYLIHGTNKEYGIGRRASRGCIRMYEDNVRELYQRVAVGTPVTAVDQPVKVAWIGNDLFLEASPTMGQVRQWEAEKRFDPVSATEARELVSSKAGKMAGRIDWPAVDRALAERRGIVTRITKPGEQPPIATAAGDVPAPKTSDVAAASGNTRPASAGGGATAAPTIALGNSGQTSGRAGSPTATAVQDTLPPASRGQGRAALPSEPTGDELVKWLRNRLTSGSAP